MDGSETCSDRLPGFSCRLTDQDQPKISDLGNLKNFIVPDLTTKIEFDGGSQNYDREPKLENENSDQNQNCPETQNVPNLPLPETQVKHEGKDV